MKERERGGIKEMGVEWSGEEGEGRGGKGEGEKIKRDEGGEKRW